MTKKELYDYKDMQIELIDLQNRIWKIENGTKNIMVSDKVRGSSKHFPFTARSFTIEGYGEDEEEHQKKLQLKQLLQQKRKAILDKTKDIEVYIDTIEDSMTRNIFRLHFLDGLSQKEVSKRIHLAQSKVSERIKEQLREKVSKN